MNKALLLLLIGIFCALVSCGRKGSLEYPYEKKAPNFSDYSDELDNRRKLSKPQPEELQNQENTAKPTTTTDKKTKKI